MMNENIPCFNHKEYKKGCKSCFDKNRHEDDDGEWIHDPEMGCRS